MRSTLNLIALTSLVLAGCGGDKGKPQTNLAVDYNQLKATAPTTDTLTLADQETLKQHIANGLRLQLSGGGQYYRGGQGALDSTAAPSAGDKSASAEGAGYSDTNVHVAGVDEADVAKYDGKHWFIANHPSYDSYLIDDRKPSIHVVATDPTKPNAEVVAKVTFDEEWGSVGDLYLVNDGEETSHIAAIRNQWGNVMPFLPGVPMRLQVEPAIAVDALPGVSAKVAVSDLAFWFRPENSQVRVQLFDVKDPTSPTEDWEIKIDGSLIDSRKVKNTLYLVTRFDPWLQHFTYENGDVAIRTANEKLLADAAVTDLMPYYHIGDSKAPLASRCLLQANTPSNYGYQHLVNITAIDLANQKVIGSTCINSGIEALSMSTDSAYLTSTSFDERGGRQQTVVHKFDLTTQGASYAATGSVSGGLGWSSDPAFRMHEAGDQFRIVTSEWGSSGPVHKLSILRDENNGRLSTLSSLPNDANPAPIGKPGEDIYSVRFQGDTAYIVTFRRTDPLYAIDLSDPLNPHIAGELAIPGFATYMHPLANNYLFTLGHNADEGGRVLGIKAELLKVTDGQPAVVKTLLLGGMGSHSDALSDLRALSVLNVGDDQVRLAFPVTINGSSYEWDYSGLQLLQVDGLSSGKAQLTDVGTIVTESRSNTKTYPSGFGTTRGILHDEAVFFTSNSAIWAAFWNAPKEAVGPIVSPKPDDQICTLNFVYGLNVTVIAPTKEADPCSAKVNSINQNGVIEQLMPGTREGNRCQFIGAGEAPGSYNVMASLPGTLQANGYAEVLFDGCHVVPVALELAPTPFQGGTFCGGFAGFECPKGEYCVDDPSDDCNPEFGGADCSGVCVTPTDGPRPLPF